ncbi:hypothetical protein [Vibrio jasicida]|uniref:hypothetical protein n=1 Tax=Vibrio jasicida TaxID=766224 RepID=UPI0006967B24|nr:hypothetical protein [Vibrio jasicida]
MSGDSSTDIKDSALNKEMAKIAKERWEHYNETIIPAQNRWMEDLANQNAEKYHQRAAGDANIASQRATGLQQAQMLEQGGNTARLAAATEAAARQQQSTTADATSRMQATQQQSYLGGLQNILAVGQGQESKALTTGSTAANYANQYAMNQAANQDNTLGELVGMGLGAATRYGMGG